MCLSYLSLPLCYTFYPKFMSLSCLYNIVKRVTQQPRVYLGELECNVALRCPGSVWTASSPPSCCLGPLLHHVQHQGLRLQHHGLPPESGESIPLPPVSSDHRLAQWSAASDRIHNMQLTSRVEKPTFRLSLQLLSADLLTLSTTALQQQQGIQRRQ